MKPICCFLISACLFFCKPSPKTSLPVPETPNKPNILWIVIDSLRGDVIGRYGVTPELEKFSKTSYVFANHLVNAAWTRPSTLVFFTGKYASRNPVNFWDYPTPQNEVTAFYESELFPLPKLLSQNGIDTVMVGNNPFVTDKNGLGVNVGFQILHEYSHLSNDTPQITKKSLEVITSFSEAKKPFFFFLNFNDPHKPYTPPSGFRERIKSDEIMEERKRDYLGEVAYIDQELSVVFDALKKKGLWDNTCIIITADHGEVMHPEHAISPFTGTNTFFGHGQDLFLENISVPLLIKFPNQTTSTIFKNRTRSIDLYPTVLELLGMQKKSDIDGESLFPIIRGEETKKRLYYGETRSTQGIGIGDDFLLQRSYRFHELGRFWEGGVGRETFYFYDVSKDPEQIHPIRFLDISEIKNSELANDLKTKIESLWSRIRLTEPNLTRYTIRLNPGRFNQGILKAVARVNVGRIRILKKNISSCLEISHSERELTVLWNSDKSKQLENKTKDSEVVFEVYPDVTFPSFHLFQNDLEITNGNLGAGSFDLTPVGCRLNCETLYDSPIGAPRPTNEIRMQVWRSGNNKKEYVRSDKLETDAVNILRKQGYIQ
ncbi:sulfatase [Leptospira kobayashii]|uniref:sulfatase n=1 Tax=Leptospira kobayashii TaxID=1917830 RepID=UPI00241ED7B8|nr:sulfatase [Leptospira kobayashii]